MKSEKRLTAVKAGMLCDRGIVERFCIITKKEMLEETEELYGKESEEYKELKEKLSKIKKRYVNYEFESFTAEEAEKFIDDNWKEITRICKKYDLLNRNK